MIPEPNLWAELRERDRSLDEMTDYHHPPHHTDSCRTLTLPRSIASHRDLLNKEEMELETSNVMGGLNVMCSNGSAGLTSTTSMSHLGAPGGMDADSLRERQRWTRRWYLLVIVLLYIGLLASFSLNVSLLLKKPLQQLSQESSAAAVASDANGPQDGLDDLSLSHDGIPDGGHFSHDENQLTGPGGGYAYTTSCLVKVPCESGNYWKCDISTCVVCPQGYYQPQWGQTSCWPCPYNTTTDSVGSTSPLDCKRRKCPFYMKDGLGIVESPNFPGEYPANSECHWRVRPGRNKRVLVIISNIELDESCGDVLTIRKSERPKSGVIYETCQGHEEPIIFTGHSRNLWVDFVANSNSSGRGFQISLLTIEDELGYLVDAIVNEDKIGTFDKRPNDLSMEDKHMLSRLLMLLNPNYASSQNNRNRRPARKKKPIINVVEEET